MAGLSRDIHPQWHHVPDDASRGPRQRCGATLSAQARDAGAQCQTQNWDGFPALPPQFCCSFPLKQAGEKKSLCISESYEIIRWHFPSSLLITRTSSHKELVCTKPSVSLRSHRGEIAELEIMTFSSSIHYLKLA